MKLKNLEELFLYELKDLFSAETQLVKALPKMVKAATNRQLREGFQMHLEQTKEHVTRLEQIGTQLGKSLTGHKCKAMEGLVEEAAELIEDQGDTAVRDAGLIGAAQRVEHYEIAGYGTARTLAQHFDQHEIADLLNKTLEEERDTDMRLTKMAESTINMEAQHAGMRWNS
jgi:ferritin-like metal-binding protein YciE